MKIKILVLSFILLFIYNPYYGLELTSEDFVQSIIKSMNEEPQNWIIDQNYIYFIHQKDQKEVMSGYYPKHNNKCFVAIYYDLFDYYSSGGPTIKFEKPIEMYLKKGSDYIRLSKIIAKMLYDKLEKVYHVESMDNPNTRNNKTNPNDSDVIKEEKKETNSDGFKKL